MNIDEILQKLIEAREAYYNSESPVMSDAEFDSLEEQLASLDTENEYFSAVGSRPETDAKIRHAVPMLSMQKAKSIAELGKWMQRLLIPSDSEFCVQPKIDGLSASFLYLDGQLAYGATRGDGVTGQDVTYLADYIDDVRKNISIKEGDIEVRGELYLPRDTAYDTSGKPLRNNCVGLINRKENRDDLKHVRFIAYQIVRYDRFKTESEKIIFLKKEKFHTVDFEIIKSIGELEKFYSEYISTLRGKWLYETDGLIIIVNDRGLHEEIDSRWVLDRHHHYAMALKPPSESMTTVLNGIEWQVSRQGNLIPVAIFEPVFIGGARLSRASLHNAENVIAMKLLPGDEIVIERANDVIPYVRENRSSSGRADYNPSNGIMPDRCPSCGTILSAEGVHLKCANFECPEIIIQQILYWVSESQVENVAEASVRALFNLGKIRSIGGLYRMTASDFIGIDGFAEKKISNFIDEIKRSKKISSVGLLSRLGIPLVQTKTLKRLGINTVDEFLSFESDEYAAGRNIIEWKKNPLNMKLLNELVGILDIGDSSPSEKKRIVCMTGKGPASRNELIKRIEEGGFEFSDTVTSAAEILLCDDRGSSSSKITKARKGGMKIMTYDEFFGGKD